MLNYEIEDASKVLAIARSLKKYKPPFRIVGGYRLIDNGIDPEATVQIEARGPGHPRGLKRRRTGGRPGQRAQEGPHPPLPRHCQDQADRFPRGYPRREAGHQHRRPGDDHFHGRHRDVEGPFPVGEHQCRVI